MSTTTMDVRFDLAGYREALEAMDAAGQLACYADDAELSVVHLSRSARPSLELSGRAAIAGQIDRACARVTELEVVDTVDVGRDLTVIADCRLRDGTRTVYACTMGIVDGLIASQHVVLL